MRIKINDGYKDEKAVKLIQLDNKDYALQLIDQRLLPHRLEFINTTNYKEGVTWITDMAVRGAPAIGATGAYCFVLAVQELEKKQDKTPVDSKLIKDISHHIIDVRPTAKDLDTFVSKIGNFYINRAPDLETLASYANDVAKDSEEECRRMGEISEHLIENDMGVLTHCNAGALATVDWGTALSPMRFAKQNGKSFKVFVDETRPRLQGMLTAWELQNEDIDYEIIVDNAAGFFMQQGKIDLVITGTDRVLRDGTVTNKIGTFEKAVVANRLGIPVYIAMPWTTFDPEIESADNIPIEFRSDREITHLNTEQGEIQVSPQQPKVSNPAFDITSPELITGYITKDGIFTSDELYTYYKENYA